MLCIDNVIDWLSRFVKTALEETISVIQFGCRVRSHWFAGCYIRGSDNSRRNQRTIIRVVISARSSLVKI